MKFDTYTNEVNAEELRWRKRRDERYAALREEGRIWGAVPREWIRRLEFPRLSRDMLARFQQHADTSALSDILDTMGIHGSLPASLLPPLCKGQRIIGHAVTQRNLPVRKAVSQSYADHDWIGMSTKDIGYLAEPGDILVMDSGAVSGASSMGGMACKGYAARGIAGAVVWGAVRDTAAIRAEGFPVWSREQTCASGKHRLYAAEINGSVALGTVLVCAGDLIAADDAGICVIPYELAGEVLVRLEKTVQAEARMEKMLEDGQSIDQIRSLDRAQYPMEQRKGGQQEVP